METFKWCVRPELSVNNEPERNIVRFGDGYTQRQRKGINTLLRTHTVSVKVRNQDKMVVDAFLSRHGGVDAFYYQDPYSGQKRKVICGKWPAKMGLHFTEFTCEFEEVP